MAKKWYEIAIKAVVLIAFSFFIWWEVFQKQDVMLLWKTFVFQLQHANPILLYGAILLMPLNWSLETYKWWVLVLEFEQISFLKALKSVLIGVAIGLFTPSRIGEYGGRAMLIQRNNVVESVVATFLGSLSQLLATLFFGYIGILYFLKYFALISEDILFLLIGLGVFSLAITLLFFYNIELIIIIFKKVYHRFFAHNNLFPKLRKLIKGWLKHINILRNYSSKQLSMALLVALGRYVVYTVQYLLLLHFMDIEVGFIAGLACIATVFLLQTSMPLPPISGLIARGGTAIYVWHFFSNNDIAILSTTFTLWIINVIIPALIGLVLLLNTRFR